MPKVGLELTTLWWRVTFSAYLATQVLLIYFDYRHHLSVPSPSAELFNLHWWNATSILNEIHFGLGYKSSWFCFPDGSPLDFICNRDCLQTAWHLGVACEQGGNLSWPSLGHPSSNSSLVPSVSLTACLPTCQVSTFMVLPSWRDSAHCVH